MFTVEERKSQYLKAFRFYVNNLSARDDGGYNYLLFCENSGVPLDEFRSLIPNEVVGKVELLSCPPEIFSPLKGKGYNEELMIDYAIGKSRVIQDASPFVFKVTGRYSIANITRIVNDFRQIDNGEIDLYIDIKDHKLYSSLGLDWPQEDADTRCFGFSPQFYKSEIAGRYVELDDALRHTLERQFFNLYKCYRGDGRMKFRFTRDMLVDGVTGHKSSFLKIPIPVRFSRQANILKYCVRSCVRRIAPGFWF